MNTLKNYKPYTIVLLALLICFQVKGQSKSNGEDFYDLVMLYLDGDYNKCIKKAIKYSEAEETKNHPLPYLYPSMCYLEISQNPELSEDFERPLKDALKWAAKYYKKDKRLRYYERNEEYFAKLRAEAKKVALEYIENEKGSRAKYYWDQILRFDPLDYSCWYQKSFEALVNEDIEEYNEFCLQFDTSITVVKDWNNEPEDRKNLLTHAMLAHAGFMLEEGRKDVAEEVVNRLLLKLGPSDKIELFLIKMNKAQ